jgi:hypothetical protein
MANKPSSPASTILFTPHNTPVSSTIHTLQHGYYFVAALTLMTFLAEVMSAVISGVPFAAGKTWSQLLVSSKMSLTISGIMIVVAVLVIW